GPRCCSKRVLRGRTPASGPRKGSEPHVGREVQGGIRPQPAATEQDLFGRPRVRRPGVRDQTLDLQQMEVLLAARTGPRLCTARQSEEPLESRVPAPNDR